MSTRWLAYLVVAVAAGARLIKYMLEHEEGVPPVAAEVVYKWPEEKIALDGVATIVFIGDLFPGETLDSPAKVKADLTRFMGRGCGMVCVHYATGLQAKHVTEDGNHPLLGWIGGYFATGGCKHWQSVARVCPATLVPEPIEHPVLRGWKAFRFEDEPYWNNYFGKEGPAKNVTPLVSAMLPPEAPKKETVVWAVGLDVAARGMGVAGKPEGMKGDLAPVLWAEGRREEVLRYVGQDVRTTLEVAMVCEGCGELRWVSRSGMRRSMPLPEGWLTVGKALALPLPDTSWMTDLWPRERFTEWMG